MTNRRLTPAYNLALSLSENVPGRSRKKKLKKTTIDENSTSIEELDEVEDFVPSNFTMVNVDIFKDLSTRAKKIVQQIIQELKPYNTLWYFDSRGNPRDSAAISELRKKNILGKTGTTEIQFVNPEFIRRGREDYVLACMIKLLESNRKVTRKDIKALTPEKKTKRNFYDRTYR